MSEPSIAIPASDFLHVAQVIKKIQDVRNWDELYVVVSEGQMELRLGANVSYGVRRFQVVP